MTTDDHEMVEGIVARVARSGAVVQSQQRGEEDISVESKEVLLRALLQQNPGKFLAKFFMFLAEEDLCYFQAIPDSYEVSFYLKEARQFLNPVRRQRVVKNRRYECMCRLLAEGVHFGDRALYHRHPLLFERYVGRFMSDDEKKMLALDGDQEAECALSSHILFQMEQERRLRLLEKQRNVEREDELACGMTVESTSTICEVDEEEATTGGNDGRSECAGWGEISTERPKGVGSSKRAVSDEEKTLLRQELMSIVQQLFLSGQERDFDYAQVDSNAEFDSLDTRQLDEEAAYFDSEEPEEALNDEEELAWLRSRAQEARQAGVDDDDVMEFDGDDSEDDPEGQHRC